MKDLLPAVLKVLDVIPFNGYRNAIFFVLTGVVALLGHMGKIPKGYEDVLVPGLIGLTGYFAGKHGE